MIKALVGLRSKYRQMVQAQQTGAMDEKEIAEREEAANAYAGENEKHFVDFLQDCLSSTHKATEDIRNIWQLCWDVYNEKEPAQYRYKAPWQSRVVVPKPFNAVQHGASAIKKAFNPDFLSIVDAANKPAAYFWQKAMTTQLDETHAQFPTRFTDATTMSLAIGLSQEMIPQWVPGRGIRFDLVEPWKISRDPDAPPRDPQSGMSWFHTEWLDYFVLQRGERAGRYFDVARAKNVETTFQHDPLTTTDALRRRKGMVWHRSNYRTMIQTHEYWGIVLDSKGEVLLPSATFTVAGGRVIQRPAAVKYRKLRWPGISFSPLPDLLAYGGRGLLKGVTRVWDSMNTLMCLHEDAMKWLVNPSKEINVDQLDDPTDIIDEPGKSFLTRDSVHGNPAVRSTVRRDHTGSALGHLGYLDQMFDGGSFVPSVTSGLPGHRSEVTAREVILKSGQAQGPFTLMGANIEHGAKWAVIAAQDVMNTLAGYDDYVSTVGQEIATAIGLQVDARTGRVAGVPEMSGMFSISGIQAMMKDAEVLDYLINTIIPLAERPRFAPYIRPYHVLRAIEKRTKLTDEQIIVAEETATAIEGGENEQYQKGLHMQTRSQDMAMQHQVLDLAERVGRFVSGGGGMSNDGQG